jgi:indole-3-glycerol phosphate synthase
MILDEIIKYKREEVRFRKETVNLIDHKRTYPTRDFASAIRNTNGFPPKVIAEVKKASPSKGIIRADFDPVLIALSYERAGASAISVLTDERFFHGRLEYLEDCRSSVNIPLLRKDFVIDEFQILEAYSFGADAILLIAAILNAKVLQLYREISEGLGMASIVEVHDEEDLNRALESGANIIGINNRDLKTFIVDIETTFRLAKTMPTGKIIVSESGIRTADEMKRLADAGIDAVLIGETLMRADDPGAKLRELITE